MQQQTFRLIMRRGPQPNQVIELTGEVSNLGRDITNEIVIQDREVSRHHLRLMRGTDGFTIEDLNSTNGTFVNGKRVTGATYLKHGDMLALGETVTLQFEATSSGHAAGQPVITPAQQPAPRPEPEPSFSAAAPEEERYKPQAPAQPAPQPAAYQAPQPARQADPAPSDYYGSSAAAAQQASYGPPPPGYDYDPYAMREEGGSSNMQWFLIGCLGLLLLCCCMTVVLSVAVDTFCLYDAIPGLSNILGAIGYPPNC